MTNEELKTLVIDALEELKANDIKVLDVSAMTDMADMMVFVSGTSSRHVKSLASNVVETVKKHGVQPVGVEGEDSGEWVLVDLADILIHVMLPETRDFYNLEQLWSVPGTTDNSSDTQD